MTDVAELLESATPDLTRERLQAQSHTIYIIWYGYSRDSLSKLFPILFIADNNNGHEKAIATVRSRISKTEENRSPDIAVKSPGTYQPPLEDSRWLESTVNLYRIQEQEDRPDRSDGTIRGVRNNMYRELSGGSTSPKNCFFREENQPNGIKAAKFEFSFARHHPEVNIPFLDERPSSILGNSYRDLQIPCYILTDGNMERKDRIYPKVYWHFPLR